MIIDFTLNGTPAQVRVVGPASMLDVLRDQLRLYGSKSACEHGECGACSIMLDGELVCSCLVLAADAQGATVETVEGVEENGSLHPVQVAMHEAGAVQCGFCTPGIVMAAVDMFEKNPNPTTSEIKEALAGNICRCTGYGAIIRALESLSGGVE